jgi:hypothetical protein
MKPKEDQLCIKEQELLQKESGLKELDLQMKSEQEKIKVSHTYIIDYIHHFES